MKGYLASLAVLAYVALTATQGVVLGSLVQRSVWHPITLLIATFSVVALFFNLAQLHAARKYLALLKADVKEVTWLNLVTIVNWVSYYWAIRTVPVSSHAAIALGIGPLIVLLLDFRRGSSQPSSAAYLSAMGLFLSLVVIGTSHLGHVNLFDLAMSITCGISLVLTLFSQRRLKSNGWSTGQLMACRFFILTIGGLLVLPTLPAPNLPFLTTVVHVTALAVLGTIVPLYLLTWGQVNCEPLTSTLLLFAMPLLMVGGELIEARVDVSPQVISGVVGTCVFLALGFFFKKEKVMKSNETLDCAVVVGGQSSGQIYAPLFSRRGIPPLHLPAAPRPPAAYAGQPLAEEFVGEIPYDESLEDTVQRLRKPPFDQYRPQFIVPGLDQAVERADRLSELLGLPSNGSAMSKTRRNKFLTVELLRESGLNAPIQFQTDNPEEAVIEVRRHPEVRAWVVKPTESAGSDRVALCKSPDEVFEAASRVIGGTNVFGEEDSAILVQEYLTSPDDDNEYVVNTCSMCDPTTGQPVHRVVSIYRYEKISLNGSPFVYYARHLLPYHGAVQKRLIDYFIACLDVLKVRQGPCHGELRMTTRGPALVEANVGRPDGGGVPKLDFVCTGHDQASLTVDSLIAPGRVLDTFSESYALLRQGRVAFFPNRGHGVLQGIPGEARLRTLPSFLDAVFLAQVGNPITPTVDVGTLLGWTFLSNSSAEALERDYRALRELESDGLFDIR